MKQRRNEKGLSQRQLAALMNTQQQTINRYEQGRAPAPDMLIKLAEALDTTVGWLLEETDDPERLTEDERELVRAYRRGDLQTLNRMFLNKARKR